MTGARGEKEGAGLLVGNMSKDSESYFDTSTTMEAPSSNHEGENAGEKQEKKSRGKQDEKNNQSVPFSKLFTFADSKDVLMMIVGTIGAMGNGASMPLLTVLLGDVINALSGTVGNRNVVHEVSKVCVLV